MHHGYVSYYEESLKITFRILKFYHRRPSFPETAGGEKPVSIGRVGRMRREAEKFEGSIRRGPKGAWCGMKTG